MKFLNDHFCAKFAVKYFNKISLFSFQGKFQTEFWLWYMHES